LNIQSWENLFSLLEILSAFFCNADDPTISVLAPAFPIGFHHFSVHGIPEIPWESSLSFRFLPLSRSHTHTLTDKN
jgi:hypothetical protein